MSLWDKTGGCQGEVLHVVIIRVKAFQFLLDCELEPVPVACLNFVTVLIAIQRCEMNSLVKRLERCLLGLS
jgi:hypothetical protein